jgi:hypothetical protein
MDSTITQQDDGDTRGDLLVGGPAIKSYLVGLGMPKTVDPYYLKRTGWPIGKTAGAGGSLIASRGRLNRHIDRIARGTAA